MLSSADERAATASSAQRLLSHPLQMATTAVHLLPHPRRRRQRLRRLQGLIAVRNHITQQHPSAL